MANAQGRRPHDARARAPRTAIGLIAKAPVVGAVKTRLCPPLRAEEAAAVAAAMLADTAANAAATGHDLWCVHAGQPEGLAPLLPDGTPLLAQRGAGLAQRLAAAQSDLHACGYQRVVLLGGDCPTVEAAYLADAVAALADHDVVLGPAADGGYTLIGTRRPHPGLFDVEMSTRQVLTDTIGRATASGLQPRCLEARHDLDTAGDLITALETGQLDHAPRTAWLVRAIRDRL